MSTVEFVAKKSYEEKLRGGYTYFVYKDGTKFMVLNGFSGRVEYKGDDVNSVIKYIHSKIDKGVVIIADAKQSDVTRFKTGIMYIFVDESLIVNLSGRSRIVKIYDPVTNPISSPLDITFSLVYAGWRPFLIDEKFKIFEDDFNIDKMSLYTTYTEGGNPSETVSDGKLTVNTDTVRTYATPITPKAAWLVGLVKIDNQEAQSGTIVHTHLTLIENVDNRLTALYQFDGSSGLFKIEARVNGSTQEIASVNITVEYPFIMAFVICGKKANVLYSKDGINWSVALSDIDISSYFDLTDESVLRNMKLAFGGGGPSGNSYTIDFVKWYYFTGVGVRDISPITYRNGAPLVKDGKIYLVATLAGLGSEFSQSHAGIIALDPNTYHVEVTALIFCRRGGLIVGDHAGHIVFDEIERKFRIMLTNWGTFVSGGSTNLVYGETKDNILEGVHVIDVAEITNPTTHSLKDPFILYDENAGSWRIIHSERDEAGTGWPAVFETTDFENFTLIHSNTDYTDVEGPIVAKIGGNYYVIGNRRVYTYPDLTYVGDLNAPHPSSMVWTAVIPIYVNGKTKFLHLTFDTSSYQGMNGTWGNLYISEGDQIENGYEYEVVGGLEI